MEFALIKKDFRELRTYLFTENDINNWDKIIVLYNLYLFFNHLYILYILLDFIQNQKTSFTQQFKSIYLFFFILCNLKNSYLYFIFNISKINKNLGDSFYHNTKEYFM
jgi:hypothetical protein